MSLKLSNYIPALKYGAVVDGGKSANLSLETQIDTKTIKLNSRDYTATSGDMIGFQSKPNATVASTGTIYGGQISPRVTAVNLATLEGLQVQPILKSTAATVSGDMRGISIDLDDDAVWTISGNAVGLRISQQLTSTVTGKIYAIKIDANGATKAWSSAIDFPSGLAGAADGSGSAVYIQCSVNGTLMKLTGKYNA